MSLAFSEKEKKNAFSLLLPQDLKNRGNNF